MSAISSPPVLCPRCGMSVEVADRFCRGCGAPLGAVPSGHELRKTVTVVFCDLVGSTALGERLDAEALRHLLGRYYAEMRGVLERHGGLVEKFIGDAVVAVFGVPLVHEDDALRAVRAALEMRLALAGLNGELERDDGVRVGVRIGVNTGEVVAGDLGPGASFASGDAVNVAARLEQAARPDEILLGSETRLLLAEAVEVEPIDPLDLRGKSEPVQAFRLVSVAADAEAIIRNFETTFVGRANELALLREVFEEAATEPGCRLLTVLGEPGIGKTRLLREFAKSVGSRARVLSGSCLPYGEGITYWPLREIVHELCQGRNPADELRSRLTGEERGERIADLILSAVGASDDPGGSVEEVQWAVRRLLEALARERTVLVVLEDLHWAEPTFLQLVEYVADCATGAPILLLAAAREDLLDETPAWALPHPHSRLLPLEPLPEPEAGKLVDILTGEQPLSEPARTRLVGAGGGNPLFLEQLAAHQAENGDADGKLPLPTTIAALLAARLDRIPTPERDVLERAAVEGLTFHRGPLTALLADHEASDVGGQLLDAIRRNLIRSCRPSLPGDEGYEFVHVLVRNAVHEAMPKELRAQLHEQFADWLEHTLAPRSGELDEILGYHLEQAAHAKQQLGRPDPALANRARELLAAAGRQAVGRGDWWAGRLLLERAAALSERPEVHLIADLAQCLRMVGDTRAAAALLDSAAGRSEDDGDVAGAMLALALAAAARRESGECSADEQEQLALAAVPVLEAADDHAGLLRIWNNLAFGAYNVRGRFEQAERAAERALEHSRLAGQQPLARTALLMGALLRGPRSAEEALARLDSVADDPLSYDEKLQRAILLAMHDRVEEARTLADTADAQLRDFGRPLSPYPWVAELEEICGDEAAAAEHLRKTCDYYAEHGLTGFLSCYAPTRGRLLCALGRYEKAEQLAEQGRKLASDDDASAQSLWREVAALVAAYRGDHTESERLAREATAILDKTDALWWQGNAYFDLAQVLEAASKPDEAAAAYREALDRYERKGIIPLARRTRERLAALQQTQH